MVKNGGLRKLLCPFWRFGNWLLFWFTDHHQGHCKQGLLHRNIQKLLYLSCTSWSLVTPSRPSGSLLSMPSSSSGASSPKCRGLSRLSSLQLPQWEEAHHLRLDWAAHSVTTRLFHCLLLLSFSCCTRVVWISLFIRGNLKVSHLCFQLFRQSPTEAIPL